MASEWQQLTVADLRASTRNALVGGPFRSNLVSSDYVSSGVPVIRGQNMSSRSIGGEFAFVTDSKAKSLEANLARPGDLVFTQRGTLGQVALVPPTPFDTYLISQSQMKLTVDKNKADSLFLYYVFSSQAQRDYIRQHAIQTGVPHTNLSILRDTPIPVPPIEEQRAIAYILGTLDDKIELNQRANETLEGTARALFKSWFVDFDPVRAKTEGRDPGLPKPLADLFPNSFEDSEIGEIPNGWTARGLDEIGRFLNGLALQKFPPQNDRFLPVIKIAQLRSEDVAEADRASADLAPEYVVEDGDVLFSWSGSLECVLWTGGRGALNQHLFKVTSEAYPKWFYFLWIRQHLTDFRGIASGKATTMGHIQRYHLSAAKVVVPSEPLLKEMDRYFSPLIDQIVQLKVASKTIAAIRDAFLPKLISGESRLKDAERIVRGPV